MGKKFFIYSVISIVAVLAGRFLTPFLAWLTGFELFVFIIPYGILFAVGIIFLLKFLLSPFDPKNRGYFTIQNKKFTFFLISTCLMSGACLFHINSSASIDEIYNEGYLTTYKAGYGLYDRWGMCFIPNKYDGIVGVLTTIHHHIILLHIRK